MINFLYWPHLLLLLYVLIFCVGMLFFNYTHTGSKFDKFGHLDAASATRSLATSIERTQNTYKKPLGSGCTEVYGFKNFATSTIFFALAFVTIAYVGIINMPTLKSYPTTYPAFTFYNHI